MQSTEVKYEFAFRWSAIFRRNSADFATAANHYLNEFVQVYGNERTEDTDHNIQALLLVQDYDCLQEILWDQYNTSLLFDAVWAFCEENVQQVLNSETENQRKSGWVSMVLARIAALLSENLLPFQGIPRAMRLVSNRNSLLAAQYPWEEILQILRIDQLGNASVSGHIHGTEGLKMRKKLLPVSEKTAQVVLNQVASFFQGETGTHDAFDAGTWELELVNTEGDTYRFTGDLYGQANDALSMLSDQVRSELQTNALFAFDGRWFPDNPLQRISLVYAQCWKDENMEPESERDATETLVIDRLSGNIEWTNRRYSYGEFRHCYHFPDQVNDLLDHFSAPELFCQPALPAEEITEEIWWNSHYRLCVQYKDGSCRVLQGNYDKAELPEYFAAVIRIIRLHMRNLEQGGIFDDSEYGTAKRRKGQMIYCSVSFENGYKTYYYRTEDTSLQVGDCVVVPTGPEDRETVAKIEKIECFSPESVPYPIEKTKCILRRCPEMD